jgi:hypothetical protein
MAVALLGLGSQAYAQQRWGLEFRTNASIPVQKLGGSDLNTGYGFEGTLAYRFMSHLGLYAGWSWNRFGSGQTFAGNNMDFEETGYTVGLQFIHPFSEQSKLKYLIRGGGIYNHIEVENPAGDIISDSGHGLGWQLEAGLAVPLGERWQLMPSVRYRSLARNLTVNETTTAVNLNYLSAGASIVWSFGK